MYIIRILKLATIIICYAIKGVHIYKKQEHTAYFKFIQKLAKKVLKAANIQLEVQGKEHIIPNETYVYIANHSSLFDIPILLVAIPDYIHFMYKVELEKAPFLGYGLKNSPFIPIKRDNPKDAMSSINEAAKAIINTGSVILFPEGSRSKTGEVGTFKRGAFLLASKTKKKIIPIAICGSEKIMPTKTFKIRPGKVKVFIGEAIENISEDNSEMKQELKQINEKIAKTVENYKKN